MEEKPTRAEKFEDAILILAAVTIGIPAILTAIAIGTIFLRNVYSMIF
tara:strand:- start:156 stop:299 length:144 start_codon:yes stop_codon:yes gene_type:complete